MIQDIIELCAKFGGLTVLQELGQRSLLLSQVLELSHGPECQEKINTALLIIIFKGHGNVLYSFVHEYTTDASNSNLN